jgi:phosphoribosyl-ATP pyrophosphohydrolase
MTDHREPGPVPASLDMKLRLLYRVYEYLRDADLTSESSTARLLHAPDPAHLRARLADELAELAGAADGTHRHRGLPGDAILEASQVCYWTFLIAVAARLPYDELRPQECLTLAVPTLPGEAAALGQILALGIRSGPGPVPAADLRAALRQVGLICRALDIDPAAPVDYDLAQMRTRAYLAAFFQSSAT